MKLKRTEKIVMDNGPLGLKKKLTLTNKRLIIQKDEGIFNVDWKQEKAISLDSIADIYLETKDFSGLSAMSIKLKKGKPIKLALSLNGSWLIGDSPETKLDEEKSIQMKMLNYRWVRAITNQLMKLEGEKKNKEIKKSDWKQNCPKCEKEITNKEYKYCPYCGRNLKSKYLF